MNILDKILEFMSNGWVVAIVYIVMCVAVCMKGNKNSKYDNGSVESWNRERDYYGKAYIYHQRDPEWGK